MKYGSFRATVSSSWAMSKIGSLILQLGQQLVAGLLDDRGPRVVVLVDAMAEAHQAEAAGLVLGHVDVLLHVAAVGPDGLEHLDAGLVGPAVQRAPQGADAGRDRGEQVGVGRADHAHGRRAAVLLVIGVHDQQQVQARSTKSGSISYGSLGTANIICRKFSQ